MNSREMTALCHNQIGQYGSRRYSVMAMQQEEEPVSVTLWGSKERGDVPEKLRCVY
jgi:hypothetical protein